MTHIPLNHNLRVRRHPQRHTHPAHHLNALAMQKARKQQFTDARRQWGSRRIRHDALAPQHNRHRHALPLGFPTAPMPRPIMMHVPVHAQRALPEQLHAIHPDVVTAGLLFVDVIRMNRVNARQRDIPSPVPLHPRRIRPHTRNAVIYARRIPQRCKVAIMRPASQDRQRGQINLLTLQHHFLTRPAPALALGRNAQQRQHFLPLRNQLAKRPWRLRLRQ